MCGHPWHTKKTGWDICEQLKLPDSIVFSVPEAGEDLFVRGCIVYWGAKALVRPKRMRDKMVFLFFNEQNDHGSDSGMVAETRQHLRTWKASLKSLRWHECINFVRELSPVKDGLRRKFDLLRFTQNLRQDTSITEGHGFQGQKTITAAASALRSNYFWSYSALMLLVAETADILSRWSEGCFLHHDKCSVTSCVYKGCRAAEMAAGFHKFLLKRFQHQSNLHVLGLMHDLNDDDRRRLADDWHTAQSRLQLEMDVKLNYWDRLPYKLFGLNCNKADVARAIGCQCRQLFDQLSPDKQRLEHPMTRRFLDHNWKGRYMLSCSCRKSYAVPGSFQSYSLRRD